MLGIHKALTDLHEAGRIQVLIDRRIDFDGIGAGVQALADRQVRGRVVAVY
jgi:hypothetical protein